MPVCKCGAPTKDFSTRCGKCHTAYMKEWRRENPKTEAHMARERVRWRARDAVRSGKIIKTQCVTCGAGDVEMHHEDYDKPLEVIWLCRSCHLALHYPERGQRKRRPASTIEWRTPVPTKLDTWLRQNFMTSQMFADSLAKELDMKISRRTVESWRQGRSTPRFKVLPGIMNLTKGKVRARDFVREPMVSRETNGTA